MTRENWQGMPGPAGKIHVRFTRDGMAEIRPGERNTLYTATVYSGAYRTQRAYATQDGDDLDALQTWCEAQLAVLAGIRP
jgi:hypothetical protein